MYISYNKMKKFVLFWLIFLSMFGPNLTFLSLPTMKIVLVINAILGLRLLLQNKNIFLKVEQTIYFYIIIFISIFALSAYHLFTSIFTLRYLLSGFVMFNSTLFIYNFAVSINIKETAKNILFLLYLSGVIHSVIMVVVYLFPGGREFIYSYVEISELAHRVLKYRLRSTGLVYSGFAQLSTINSLLLILGQYIYFKKVIAYRIKNVLLFLIGQTLLLFGVLLSGRTGLLNIMLGFMIYFILNKKRLFILSKNKIKFVLIIIALIISTVLIIDIDLESDFFKWSLELFINIFAGEGLKTESTSLLFSKMYFLPNDNLSLICGEGQSWIGLGSDVGYVQMIFENGLIGLSLIVILFSVIFYKIYSNVKNNLALRNFTIFYFLITFTSNFKDLYFFFLTGYTFILFILFWIAVLDNNNGE